mmetsp:Transcript_16212/g.25907  ORF Transcript_16212/g.25907 Transcript_16212/m.25907 type:complete len:361 (-) Transcript_16212:721-1803(-)
MHPVGTRHHLGIPRRTPTHTRQPGLRQRQRRHRVFGVILDDMCSCTMDICVQVNVAFVHVFFDEHFVLLRVTPRENEKVFRTDKIDKLFEPVLLAHLLNSALNLNILQLSLSLALCTLQCLALILHSLFHLRCHLFFRLVITLRVCVCIHPEIHINSRHRCCLHFLIHFVQPKRELQRDLIRVELERMDQLRDRVALATFLLDHFFQRIPVHPLTEHAVDHENRIVNIGKVGFDQHCLVELGFLFGIERCHARLVRKTHALNLSDCSFLLLCLLLLHLFVLSECEVCIHGLVKGIEMVEKLALVLLKHQRSKIVVKAVFVRALAYNYTRNQLRLSREPIDHAVDNFKCLEQLRHVCAVCL